MSNTEFKPLNPTSVVKEGRLAGLLYFISKLFTNCQANFKEFIVEENRENGYLVIKGKKDDRRIIAMTNSMYKGGWSLMRKPGEFKDDDIIMMLGMSVREDNDPMPRKLFTFRLSDVETNQINTKVGQRDATFFSMDKRDSWDMYACDFPDVAKSVRSLIEGVMDPDITAGPFASYLTSLVNNTLETPTSQAGGNGPHHQEEDPADSDDSWDETIPF